jgi:hypothetical protein
MNPHPIKRIRDLPADEQQPFTEWLAYQTRPEIDGEPGYYEHDYKRWYSQRNGRLFEKAQELHKQLREQMKRDAGRKV